MQLVSKAWILFFRVSKLGPCFTAVEEDGGNKRLVDLELASNLCYECRNEGPLYWETRAIEDSLCSD